ncbi:Alpha/beta hydrolase family protein [Pedobacter suwonensis]|uniref:Alpha/beta hydrolase family protein n=1 Tax=Pedobacter suwonensis TaxID=332999 RepID=A0A1I0TDD2_9SPHI|nr:prolyl oligopeptidase family serine peptidase [Pedobacter suwonensis]SFA49583.1 Alpha/beta hydrolase family protein [Pedobacter suwonensis]
MYFAPAMQRNSFILASLLWLVAFTATAQKQVFNDAFTDSLTSAQTRKELNNLSANDYLKQTLSKGNQSINYRLLLPAKNKSQKKYPLVVTFHNSTRIGTDNEKQLEPLARIWLRPDIRRRYQAFVIAPQFQTWSSNYYPDSVRNCLISKPSDDVHLLLDLIREVKNKYPQIDPNRIYLVGYSMGASTAQNLMNMAPETFAAMVSIAAVPDFVNIKAISQKPIWLIHGRQDYDNPYEGSEHLYRALKGNRNLLFTTYNKLDHNLITIPLLLTPQIPAWLFSQHQ